MVTESHWDNLKAELKANVKSNLPLVAIGSGGNINKIFSLSKKKEGKPYHWIFLKNIMQNLVSISVEERMHLYKFREDRADVIVPALQIYINLMRWADIEEIYVPKIGLVDGLAHALYQEIVINQNYSPSAALRIAFNSCRWLALILGYVILSSLNASRIIWETINRAFSLSSAGMTYQGA